jgi:hypothetical protein
MLGLFFDRVKLAINRGIREYVRGLYKTLYPLGNLRANKKKVTNLKEYLVYKREYIDIIYLFS